MMSSDTGALSWGAMWPGVVLYECARLYDVVDWGLTPCCFLAQVQRRTVPAVLRPLQILTRARRYEGGNTAPTGKLLRLFEGLVYTIVCIVNILSYWLYEVLVLLCICPLLLVLTFSVTGCVKSWFCCVYVPVLLTFSVTGCESWFWCALYVHVSFTACIAVLTCIMSITACMAVLTCPSLHTLLC